MSSVFSLFFFLLGLVDIVQVAANTEPPSKTNPPYNYGEALAKVLLFYDSMVSVSTFTGENGVDNHGNRFQFTAFLIAFLSLK